MPATEQGKTHALKQLEFRRANKPVIPENHTLPAGSPMYFACLTCGGRISVPESYINKPDLCDECSALQKLGWLE